MSLLYMSLLVSKKNEISEISYMEYMTGSQRITWNKEEKNVPKDDRNCITRRSHLV